MNVRWRPGLPWFRGHRRGLLRSYPTVAFDRPAVLFGAATHDIGKIAHPGELSGPGSDYEAAGYELLLAQGIDERLARFARTHGCWDQPDTKLDDLLVSLADKVWKAKRVPDLEQLVVARLADATGEQPWQTFLKLDEELDRLAAGADHRLDFQNQYPVAA
ncbi:phosphohydrolase [Amycolatopsis sp. DSM 110486]|uniref:phosphohydrolase n=1 Tax=Amycolatopsis sp. DSM 110486 TaxID=2865832 RepID=UPI001C69A2A0|nr:phosphohydrolase [Amycolatopsis sp. DSM 110486]QYN19913.1 phosphohydrolase [Amycolatopsis sp. DSM 110486]